MWKKGISDNGLKRLSQYINKKEELNNEFSVHKIRYAEGEGTKYTVFPIYEGDALATLTNESTGEKERVPISDLFEFYILYDMDENVIHTPEDIIDY